MNVLHICANPKPTEDSASKQLAITFFSKLIEIDPDIEITNVDLYQDPPPYLSYSAIRGFWYPITIEGYSATSDEQTAMEYAQEQGRMFKAADVLVLTMPMWNYTVPAIMKAWMDQVFTPGNIFTMDKAEGIKPLHRIRKVILLVSSGGVYKEADERDALTSQVEHLFSWVGIKDVGIAWADGQDLFLYEKPEETKEFATEAAQELAEDVAELAKDDVSS